MDEGTMSFCEFSMSDREPVAARMACSRCGNPEYPEKLSAGSEDAPPGLCRKCVLPQEPGPGTPEAGAQEIQRFRPSLSGLGDEMVADPDGLWVRFEDHLADPEAERALRERDALKAEVGRLRAENEGCGILRDLLADLDRPDAHDLADRFRGFIRAQPDKSLTEERGALSEAIEASLLCHYGKTAQELAVGATEENTGGPGNWAWLALEALRKAGRLP
jgi:hypothetical protein